MNRIVRISALGFCGAVLLSLAACGRRGEEPEYQTIEGTAESIDPATNEVAMRWYNSRKQREITVSGVVTDQTEIFIDGKVARLEDVKVGERVKATGRRVKGETKPQIIATRIEVFRDHGPDEVPTTHPSTIPAQR